MKVPRGQRGARFNCTANQWAVWAVQIGAKLEKDMGKVTLDGRWA